MKISDSTTMPIISLPLAPPKKRKKKHRCNKWETIWWRWSTTWRHYHFLTRNLKVAHHCWEAYPRLFAIGLTHFFFILDIQIGRSTLKNLLCGWLPGMIIMPGGYSFEIHRPYIQTASASLKLLCSQTAQNSGPGPGHLGRIRGIIDSKSSNL